MPRVPVQVQATAAVTVDDGANPPITLGQQRLAVWVKLGGENQVRQVIIDTGAPVTFIPNRLWVRYSVAGWIRWRCHPPDSFTRDRLPTFQVLGGRYPYRLGYITVQPVGLTAGVELPAVEILAQFLEDRPIAATDPPELPPLIVLGMEQGILRGRYLVVGQDENQFGRAWLTDEEPK